MTDLPASQAGNMTDLPAIVIVLSTWWPEGSAGWSRRESTTRSLRSWRKHLIYDGPLDVMLADDGSHPATEPARSVKAHWGAPLWAEARRERRGMGASINAGFGLILDPGRRPPHLAAYFQDDWVLDAPYDLTPWARLLLRDESVGIVRLGLPHPDLTGKVEHLGDLGWGLRLDRHHYAFATRPALYHGRWWRHYGPFAEGVSAMECERMMAERFCADPSGPDVMLALPHPWRHVGQTEIGDIVPGVDDGIVTEGRTI